MQMANPLTLTSAMSPAITLRSDGIVVVDVPAALAATTGGSADAWAPIDALTGARPALHCLDLRRCTGMDRSCREAFANRPCTAAAALVVSHPRSQVIGSSLLGLSKARFPVRLFSSLEPAIEWLHYLGNS